MLFPVLILSANRSLSEGFSLSVCIPMISVEVEQFILDDLRNRVQLSSVALPSVSFYTFINAHNGLNCSTIPPDGSLVAAGFSDSSLKIWDMAKLGQQAVGSVLQGDDDANPNEFGSNGGKRPYTLFQGHSGPVYSASFSPMGDFILSSSADSTIRLWRTELNANLVCYKGHNYPVWDVQVYLIIFSCKLFILAVLLHLCC
ncbi:transcription initiation factor TFIID subunit 5-like [Humulus lupulus]|uniref:transcription initiation factor TFIID subunit 5-like n=1 Tax=Humulus lupulus TaxID=3486 RepID=UPI002B407CE5|nr:transcription initiation factor TFIID subunit 5-like [Humulus lupulus]